MKEKLFNFVGLINSLLEEMEKQNENISKIVSLYPTTKRAITNGKINQRNISANIDREKLSFAKKVTMETYQKSTH